MVKKKGLGKGLDALFFDNTTEISERATEMLKINEIEPNRLQPRKIFEDEALQQLADSIREHGLLQPLLVRPLAAGGYQIIAGERRWRASRMAGLSEVPVVVRETDDMEAMELALIENLQRENLNPIEEAQGMRELMEKYHMTQAEVSQSVGKSRSAVANTLRLLNLPAGILDHLKEGRLSPGHARALLSLEDETQRLALAQRTVRQGLSVRELERLVKLSEQEPKEKNKAKPVWADSYYGEVELALKEELGRKIKIKPTKSGGVLEITFHGKEDLQALMEEMTRDN